MDTEHTKFTEEHEWVRPEGESYRVGITDYAQTALGDITYIELPKVGTRFEKMQEAATVESVKAASDIYAPVGGVVTAVNDGLESTPELVNKDPYGEGWLFTLGDVDPAEFEGLMDKAAYDAFVEGLQ